MTAFALALMSLGVVAAGGVAAPAPVADESTCITMPTTPARDGFRVFSQAHNGCSAPTTLWLIRHAADGSPWHTPTEVVLMPGTSGRLDMPCRGTGTQTYSAVQFDPNMAFNLSTPRVLISC
ncbi:hypothetical protein [Micromonospora sp. NPDC007230]|uniref:hypothetical protein n=1 Tax=Micromonospora sp. NPDC007230 TaxID=3364237 RepID=UPI00368E258B